MRLLPIPIRPRSDQHCALRLKASKDEADATQALRKVRRATERNPSSSPNRLRKGRSTNSDPSCRALQRCQRRSRKTQTHAKLAQAARPAGWRATHRPGGLEEKICSSCQSSGSSGTLSAGMKTKSPGHSGTSSFEFEHGSKPTRSPRPNPSIERTRTGRPRYARSSFSASRGLPARAAHVKR